MRNIIQTAKLLQWPTIYAVLAILLNDRWTVIAFIVVLLFRRDLASVLRRRCIEIEVLGFRGRISGDDTKD